MSYKGIVVYEIIDNGKILNGIYTNTGMSGPQKVFCEIAIRKPGKQQNPLISEYTLSINEEKKVINGTMVIEDNNDGTYTLRQYDNSSKNPIFEGFGLKSGNNHMSFIYK